MYFFFYFIVNFIVKPYKQLVTVFIPEEITVESFNKCYGKEEGWLKVIGNAHGCSTTRKEVIGEDVKSNFDVLTGNKLVKVKKVRKIIIKKKKKL